MNFEYIEYLVKKAKNGDEKSKEKLCEEFKPFIHNLSRKTFIDGYDFYDIQSECYKNLFKCLSLYKPQKHRFVAYAAIGIKNNINDLIKRSKNRSSTDGNDALSFSDNIEENLIDKTDFENLLCYKSDIQDLNQALKNLNEEEQELINFIFFKNYTVRTYAYFKNICYSTAIVRKKSALNKIYKYINNHRMKYC